MTVLVLVAFLVLQALIGLWASRRVSSEADFYVAGKKLGAPLVTMSLFATWFGAEACLGASGAVYERGLSGGRADPFGYTLCLVLLGLLLAGPLARGNYLTLGDLYRQKFGARTERLAILLLVPSALLWGGAQIRALGELVAQLTPLSTEGAVVISAAVVVGYTFVGGLWGDVVTDLVQGFILTLGLLFLFGVVLVRAPEASFTSALTPERLSLLPEGESIWTQLNRWSIPLFGSLVTQELVARLLAARSPSVARISSFWAAGIYLFVGGVPVVLGLIGPALAPDLADPELLLPTLAERLLPRAASLAFLCALLAALLSTVDSILLSASALVSHNLLVPLLGIERDEVKLWLGRCIVIAAGGVSLAAALSHERIYELVELASSVGTAGLVTVTLAALYGPRPSGPAAFTALTAGAVVPPVAEYGFACPAPFLLGVVAATLGYFFVALGQGRGGARTRG